MITLLVAILVLSAIAAGLGVIAIIWKFPPWWMCIHIAFCLVWFGVSFTLAAPSFLRWTVFVIGVGIWITRAVFKQMTIRATRIKDGRRRSGLCKDCGYDLRFLRDRCPECGRAIMFRIFLYDDDVHTFADVVEILKVVVRVDSMEAWAMTSVINEAGSVFVGKFERESAMDICGRLRDRGLHSSMVPDHGDPMLSGHEHFPPKEAS